MGEKNESPIANGRNPFAVFNKLQKFRQFASFILIFEQCGKKKHSNFAQFYISARERHLDHAENMMEEEESTLAPMGPLSTVAVLSSRVAVEAPKIKISLNQQKKKKRQCLRT